MAQERQRSGFGMDPDVEFWTREIDDYERMTDKWLRRGRKIQKRYKDIRTPREEAITRFNVFWANVQIRLPALYARNPKAVVERRYKDKDPVGRVASQVLERSIQYTLDSVNDTKLVNRQAILDLELVGRASSWVRYVPHFKQREREDEEERDEEGEETPPAENAEMSTGPQMGGSSTAPHEPTHSSELEIAAQGTSITNVAESEIDEIEYEETFLDYVSWEDYGHTWCRTYDEMRAKWRKVYLDRDELTERFCGEGMLTKEEIAEIPLDWSPRTLNDSKVPITRKKAVVYEIWDKRQREVLWVVKQFRKFLDRREDPMKLQRFFPAPRPILANACNDDMIPVPNIVHYQDQANEIDELSSRIASITKALKVAGVRDASAEGLDRLLAEGVENSLVPVEGWAIHKEKGGLKGVYELLPMQEIAETLGYLREQRKELIDDVYQLTGISDIVRGLSDPNETATAQQLKGQFSVLRIQDAQDEVQRFCREQVHIIGEVVSCYDINTLKAISGVKLLTNVEKQQLQQQLAIQALMAQRTPQPAPGPAPSQPAGPISGPQPGGAPPSAGVAAPPTPAIAPAAPGAMHPMAPPMSGAPMPGQAPISPDKLALLEQPTWEEVEGLLRNPVLREFRLDIETDSTIRMDEQAEKAARLELITKVAEFLQQAIMAGQMSPEIVPMLAELLMFGIRAFSTARPIEQTFEDAMQALEQAAKQPKGPDPEMVKAQLQSQTAITIAQGKAQIEGQAAQARLAMEAHAKSLEEQAETARQTREQQGELQMEQYKAAIKAHMEGLMQESKQHFEAQKAQFEADSKERLAMLEHELESRRLDRTQKHERDMAARQPALAGPRAKRNGNRRAVA